MNTKNSLITMSMFAGWLLKYSDWYVWALALACLYAILQIKLDFAFWIVNNDRADVYNEIIVNLSYSYLAGFIFFLLTVTLPHRKMRTKVRKSLEEKTNVICSNYKSCVESVIPLPKAMLPTITKEEAIVNFRLFHTINHVGCLLFRTLACQLLFISS